MLVDRLSVDRLERRQLGRGKSELVFQIFF